MIENKKRLAVFIDGSNFYFKLKSLEIKNLSRFNFRGLIDWLARDREIVSAGYYVGVVRAKPNDERGQKLRRAQRDLFNFLNSRAQRITVHRGYLMKNDNAFHEKGVDVKIATDLLVGAYENLYDEALIISSDTDLIPAILDARKEGKQIIYVGFTNFISKALKTNCSKTFVITKKILESCV